MGRGRLQKNYDGEFRTEMSNSESMTHVASWRRWPYSCLLKDGASFGETRAGKQHTEGEENRTLSDHSQIPRKISNLSISPSYPELESLDPVPLLILPVWCPSNSL